MINFYAFSLKRVLCIIILLIFIWVCIGLWSSDKNRRLGVAWRYTNNILCIVSFFLILKMTILGRKVGERELELLPFYTIHTIPYNNEAIRTMLMNIILFLPLGLSLPYVFSKIKRY